SLALALNGQLWEVCDLGYLLALARQQAGRAQLTPGERAMLLEHARHLTALLAALAGLADKAEAQRRRAAGVATPKGAWEPRQVALARGPLRCPPAARPLPLAAEALRCCLGPPRWGLRLERCRARLPPRRGAMRLGRHPAPWLGPARPLWGPWRRCLLQEGPPPDAPPAPGPLALPGASAAGAGGGGVAAAAGPAPAGGGAVALARLVDVSWIGSPALQLDAFTAGTVLETPTHDPTGEVDGPDGVYLSVSLRGASLPAHALELDPSFPAPGAGQPGVLHRGAGGAAACRAPRLGGRGERHADWLRLRSARGLVEPRVRLTFRPPGGGGPGDGAAPAPARGRLAGAAAEFAAAAAAAEAAGPAARPLVAGRGRHEQSRSDGEERAGGDQLDFRVGPSRGNAVLAVADGRPGTLCNEAIAQITRVMGLRDGAAGQTMCPRTRAYLQALAFGHHPFHTVGERTVRDLQALAAAMDLLEDGSLASVADTRRQRFRALEMALNDGSWYIANELEAVEGIRPTLASRDEQESARRAEPRARERPRSPRSGLLRDEAWRSPPRRGRGGRGPERPAGTAPALVLRRRRAARSCWALPESAAFVRTSRQRRAAARAASTGDWALSGDDARGEANPLGPAGARAGCMGEPEPPVDSLAAGRETARAGAAWPEAGAPLAVLFRTWQEKARAAAESFRRPLDAGPILEELMREFPGSLGVYVVKFMHSGHRPTRRGWLRRDLQTLPCPDLEEEKIDPGDLASLQSRSRVIMMAMYWEAGYRQLEWAVVCGLEPNAAQRSALLGIARHIYSSVALEPAMARTLDWSEKLKDWTIAYDGSEVSTPSKIALEQIEGGLPPVGVAASIEAADPAADFAWAALLDPALALPPPAQRHPAPTSARVRATAQEWEQVVSALFARGVVVPFDEGEIATRDEVPLIDEAFGVAKVHVAPARCGDGEERPFLRLIVNLIPASACQRVIAGRTPVMPTMGQLNGLVLAPGEQLLWSGAGRSAFSCVFRAPPAWWPHMAPGPPGPRRRVGGSGDGLAGIASRVIGVGWISAVGVTAHLHRNMLRQAASRCCFVYVDNLEIAEIVPSEEAVALKGTIPVLLSRASAGYEEAESPGSPGKDVHRAQQVYSLGGLVDGEAGVQRPPLSYVTELVSLTLWFLGERRPRRRLAQILLGRWVRVQCYRRPLAAAFVNAWKWLASGRSGWLITPGVAEDLLTAAALAPLSVADMRLTVDHLATASDASEAAEAIVYPLQGLSDKGRALGARGPRALNPACEEGVALISVFSEIDGARQAFEIPGLFPAAHLSSEVGAKAVRVARRAYPSTVHLGGGTAADPAHLAGLLRGHGRITKVIVINGFPCQGFTVVNVAREGSADPRSQLVGHMWGLIEGLKRELPEAAVDFLRENAAPMAEDEVLALNKMFGRVPVSLDAADPCWVRRPLLYWLSWGRLPAFEMSAEMKAAADGAQPRACRVRLATELPPVSEWPPRGASWPGAAAGGRLPTFARWALRSSPRPRPAGLRQCTPKGVARWTAASYAGPPYQFQDCFCLHWADVRKEPPLAVGREVLMGSRRGRTVPCMSSSSAKSDPERLEVLRRSLVGNSFQCEVVPWWLSHWAVHHSTLVAVPSLRLWAGDVETLRCGREAVCEENPHLVEEAGRAPAAGAGQEARAVYVGRGSRRWGLGPSKRGNPCPVVPGRPAGDAVALFGGWLRSQPEVPDQLGELEGARLLCRCPSGEPCHAAVLLAELEQRGKWCSRPFLEHQRVVASLEMTCRHSGAGLRVVADAGRLARCSDGMRSALAFGSGGRTPARLQDQAKHIDVFECEAALRWRARSVSRQMCVFLHLLDSMVNIGALAMRRSSSQQLNKAHFAKGEACYPSCSRPSGRALANTGIRRKYQRARQRFVELSNAMRFSLPVT
ncbi:unnamed protein product, partial [Prorocentrum cordatum]